MANKFYTIKLSIFIVIIFVIQIISPVFTDWFVLDQTSYSQVWRFISSIFLHGGLLHLIYNLFALLLFGLVLESTIGSKKFILTFLLTGILANIFSINFYDSSLGASGAIFGVIGCLIILRPLMTVWAYSLPMPLFLAGILWAIGDSLGIFMPSNVANIAHLSGLFFGLILGALFKDWTRKQRNNITVNENEIRHWENTWMK